MTMKKNTAVALAALLMLAGCATPTVYQAPDVQVPQTWQQGNRSVDANAAAAAALSPWWKTLQDPVLDELINQALAKNNDLAATAIKVRRAMLQAGQADSNLLPNFNLGTNTRASQDLGGSSTSRSHSVSASANWELDLWGRLASLRDAAQWELEATQEDRQAAAMSLVANVASQYWQVAYLNQRIAASEQSIAYATQTLKLVEGQYSVGAVSGLEVAQAKQSVASQEAAHTQWIQQRVQARNALAVMLDGPPGVAQNESLRLPEGELPDVDPGLPASLLTRRPDLKATELRLRKNLANVNATKTSFYPTLSLTGSIGTSSSELSNVLRDPVGALGAGLVLPFIQWRDMDRTVAISEADYELAVLAYRQAWYNALSDVENALSSRVQYESQGQFLAEALKSAQTSERLAEARYRAGAAPLKTWLDAQESRRQAENSLAQNRLNRLNAMATLYQSLGGSWSVE